MTHRQLAEKILAMPEEQQDTDVSVFLKNTQEVFPAMQFFPDWSDPSLTESMLDELDVLDKGHPFLMIDA